MQWVGWSLAIPSEFSKIVVLRYWRTSPERKRMRLMMPWFAIVLVHFISLSICFSQTSTSPVGESNDETHDNFANYLTSNSKEMVNVPVYFTKPLPSWLKGTLVRNGPGKFENGDRTFIHLFDGFAKLASWKFFGNGTVLFSTRFIKSGFYKDSIKSNTIAPYMLFQSVKPPFSFFERMKCLFRGIDNMNINIYEFRNPKSKRREYAALSDFWIMYKVSINKLSTKHRVVPKIKKRATQTLPLNSWGLINLLSSAHPLPEFGRNNHFTFLSTVALFPWQSNKINLIRIKSLTRRKIIAQWSVDRVPYMHSFSVTQSRVILLASPYYVDMFCMVIKAEPFSCMNWYQDEPSTLYVVHLKNMKVDAIKIPNTFTMHHVNAYDTSDGNIIMDISSYPNPDFVKHLQINIMRDPVKRNEFEAHARLKRVTINMSKKTAVVADVDLGPPPSIASFLDLPIINEAYRSKHYCYVYGFVLKTDNVTLSNIAIVKKDLCHGGRGDKVWQVPGQYPGEPWFVGHPQSVEEDEGIIMVPAFRGAQRSTYLVMLDAKDLSVIDESKVPTFIPFPFHGRFFHNM